MRPPPLLALGLAFACAASPAGAAPEREGKGPPALPPHGAPLSPSGPPLAAMAANTTPLALPPTLIPAKPAASAAASGSAAVPAAAAAVETAAASQEPASAVIPEVAGQSVLEELGMPAAAAQALESFISEPRLYSAPAGPVIHDTEQARAITEVAAKLAAKAGLSPRRKTLVLAAAALHAVDPSRPRGLPPRTSATLAFLTADKEAVGLMRALEAQPFEGEPPLSARQIRALVRAMAVSRHGPSQVQRAEFEKEVPALFAPDETIWALEWGRRLSFARAIAPYLGDPESAKQSRLKLARELRALASSGTGRQEEEPSDARILEESFRALGPLRQDPSYELLPESDRRKFQAALAALAAFDPAVVKARTNEPDPALVEADVRALRLYARSLLRTREPTPRELEAFLEDFLVSKGASLDSGRGRALRRAVLPERVRSEEVMMGHLEPELVPFRSAIFAVSQRHRLTSGYVKELVQRSDLPSVHSLRDGAEMLESAVALLVLKDQLSRLTAKYPRNAQGETMRMVASLLTVRGGDSIEETLRDGVFMYADFPQGSPAHVLAGRDPDDATHQVVFYARFDAGRWHIEVYRQNHARGRSTPDAVFESRLRAWLVSGGIPPEQFK